MNTKKNSSILIKNKNQVLRNILKPDFEYCIFFENTISFQ